MIRHKKILLLILLSLVLSACNSSSDRISDDVLLGTFLLNENDLPENWIVRVTEGEIPRNYLYATEAIYTYVAPSENSFGTDQSLYRFDKVRTADRKFNSSLAPEVINSGEFIPEEWEPLNLTADEEKFSCEWQIQSTTQSEYMLCIWRARYGNILVTLYSRLDVEEITLDDVRNLILSIDHKFN